MSHWVIGICSLILSSPVAMAQWEEVSAPPLVNQRVNVGTLSNDSDRLAVLQQYEPRGSDPNGDFQLFDRVPYVYDEVSGEVLSTGFRWLFNSRLPGYLASNDLLVFLAREKLQREDLTGDGDYVDRNIPWIWDGRRKRAVHADVVLGFGNSLLTDWWRVADGWAVFVVFEEQNDRDLNGDGDRTDQIGLAYDAEEGVFRWLPFVNRAFAIQENRVATTVLEDEVGDVNGDGDTFDAIACLIDLKTAERTLLPHAARLLRARGDTAIIAVSELGEGQDLNGDGDTSDNVLAYRDLGSGQTVFSGVTLYSTDFWFDEDRLVCLASEAADRIDYNGDGDRSDGVVVAFDRQSGALVNSGLAATRFEVIGDHALVLVPEQGQGEQDLNGDGNISDEVLAELDLVTGLTRIIGSTIISLETDGECAVVILDERDLGEDFNGDGDAFDWVAFLYDPIQGLQSLGLAVSARSSKIRSGRVALGVYEISHFEEDLNGDGDLLDVIPFFLDLRSRTVFHYGVSVGPGISNQPGPIWLGAETAAFGIYESEQTGDLDKDGQLRSIILHSVDLSDAEGGSTLPAPGLAGFTRVLT
ncbi:MAG: hypothetical protein RL885_01820 [Planctomycetota bacterium]